MGAAEPVALAAVAANARAGWRHYDSGDARNNDGACNNGDAA